MPDHTHRGSVLIVGICAVLLPLIVAGCGRTPAIGAGSVQLTEGCGAFAAELSPLGITLVEHSEVPDSVALDRPTPVIHITVQADVAGDIARELASRVFRLASLAVGRGEFEAAWIQVTALDAHGRRVSEDEGPVSPATGETGKQGVTDEEAAGIVRRYFAASAADGLAGLTVANVKVATEMGERTLSIDLISDGSDRAGSSLRRLYYGGTSPESWPGDLNEEYGLGIVWVRVTVAYPSGAPDSLLFDLPGQSVTSYGGAPRFHIGGPATTWTPETPPSTGGAP
jgi:hypothetical protein